MKYQSQTNIQKMGEAVVKLSVVEEKIFNALVRNAKCDTGEEIDSVGFTSHYMNWHLNFYGCLDADHAVVVDEVGRTFKGDWEEWSLSEQQLAQLQQLIYKQLDSNNESQQNDRYEEIVSDWDEQSPFGFTQANRR